MEFNNKHLADTIVNQLTDDDYFEHEFIDKHKFKVRFYKILEASDFISKANTEEELLALVMDVVMKLTKSIIKENVDSTLSGLKDKGIIKEVITENGDIGYSMNHNK
jgi:hypothetical protein